MQWTDVVRHLNLSAVFTHRVFKSELIGLISFNESSQINQCVLWCRTHRDEQQNTRVQKNYSQDFMTILFWIIQNKMYNTSYVLLHLPQHVVCNDHFIL
jgi:hypothetical protein